jgi:hypothetical protein
VYFRERVAPQKPPLLLKLVVMGFIYTIIIQLMKLAGLDPYENYIITIFGFILIAPLLHKLSEVLIVEFLVKYTAGSAVVGLLEYLNIISILNTQTGDPTPVGKMTPGLKIMLFIISLIFIIIIGYIADRLYNYFKYKLKFSDAYGKLFLMGVLLLLGHYFSGTDGTESPTIWELTPNENPQVNSTIVWTAKVINPSNANILYRFFLNDKPVTDWMPQNQWIWTISDANVGVTKVEVRIKGERMAEGAEFYDIKYILINIERR